MRSIDADGLKKVFKEKSTEAVCGAELCKAIISQIDNQPTVDAIPVEWIEKFIENAGFVAVLNSHSVEFMLRQWYREQAERKEE